MSTRVELRFEVWVTLGEESVTMALDCKRPMFSAELLDSDLGPRKPFCSQGSVQLRMGRSTWTKLSARGTRKI